MTYISYDDYENFIPYPLLRAYAPIQAARELYDAYYVDNGLKHKDVLPQLSAVKKFMPFLNLENQKNFLMLKTKAIIALSRGLPFEYHSYNPANCVQSDCFWYNVDIGVPRTVITDKNLIAMGVPLPSNVQKEKASFKLNASVKKLLYNHIPKEEDYKVKIIPFAVQQPLYKDAPYIVWLADALSQVIIPMRGDYFDLVHHWYNFPKFHVDPNFANCRLAHVVEIRAKKATLAEQIKPQYPLMHLGLFDTVAIVNGLVLPEFIGVPEKHLELFAHTYPDIAAEAKHIYGEFLPKPKRKYKKDVPPQTI